MNKNLKINSVEFNGETFLPEKDIILKQTLKEELEKMRKERPEEWARIRYQDYDNGYTQALQDIKKLL